MYIYNRANNIILYTQKLSWFLDQYIISYSTHNITVFTIKGLWKHFGIV